MTIRGMIFDFDGTLADTIPLCLAAFRDVTRNRLGRDFSDTDVIALFGPSEEGIFQQLAGNDWESCHADFLAFYEREHDTHASVFPGVIDMLAVLTDVEIPVAIVTGKGAKSAAISLKLLGLDPYFKVVESGSPEGSVKPAAIRRIVQQWGVDPTTVAYVGDAPNDVSEARTAGVIPLAAAWSPSADRNALAEREPTALFTSVDDLTHWIRHNTDG